jgi:signal transduction histidine kinase
VSDTSATIVWAFIAGVLAVVILVGALGAALVISQRRFVAMHRAHSRSLLTAQEEERAWVAREVHDDAVQRLALLSREIEAVGQLAPALDPVHSHRLSAIREELQELATALRGLAHRLHPALLEKGGLHAALRGLCGEVERAYGLRIVTELPDGGIPTDPVRALATYRVAQQALHNVASHSGAAEATLSVSRSADVLRLVVADRGRGFDARQRRPGDGLGLLGMQERAQMAGGVLAIHSRPGEGTVVELSFPPAASA